MSSQLACTRPLARFLFVGHETRSPSGALTRGTGPRSQRGSGPQLPFRLAFDRGREQRHHVDRRIVQICFDVDDLGIARVKAAQLLAYWSGIAFLVEDLLPVVIGRPPAVAAVVPAGARCIGSGSERNTVRHCAIPFSPGKRSCKLRTLAHLNRSHRIRLCPKKDTYARNSAKH